jgi:hypothetical protein
MRVQRSHYSLFAGCAKISHGVRVKRDQSKERPSLHIRKNGGAWRKDAWIFPVLFFPRQIWKGRIREFWKRQPIFEAL